MTPETLFDYCDTDKNGRTNILDAKIGLERLFQVDKNVFPAIIAFVKELKFIFKTSEFDRARFVLFMKDPTNSYIHEGKLA